MSLNYNIINYLNNMGDVIPLKPFINSNNFKEEIKQFSSDWKIYNPLKEGYNRFGLSITSLDGKLTGEPDLYSLLDYKNNYGIDYKESQFQTFTEVRDKINSLEKIFNLFDSSDFYRSHFLKLNKGGFFPPHRDAPELNPQSFRLFMPCSNCYKEQFVFILDNKKIELEPFRLYYLNTRKTHSVFSYVDECIQLILNIKITEKTIQTVINNFLIK